MSAQNPDVMRWQRGVAAVLVAVVLAVSGCSVKHAETAGESREAAGIAAPVSRETPPAPVEDPFEDYGEDEEVTIPDPLESWNRMWFRFNHVFLLDVMKPLYRGYCVVMPQPFRNGLSNALHNMQAPIRIVNRLLQGEIKQMWVEIGRFVVNSTLGGGGLLDVTAQNRVLVPFSENGADFGTTLSVWGVGEGCYLVWPFFGPSTVRDTVGLVGDAAASPFFWGAEPIGPVDTWTSYSTSAALKFNAVGRIIDGYELIVNNSVEPYVALRDAYVHSRRAFHMLQAHKVADVTTNGKN